MKGTLLLGPHPRTPITKFSIPLFSKIVATLVIGGSSWEKKTRGKDIGRTLHMHMQIGVRYGAAKENFYRIPHSGKSPGKFGQPFSGEKITSKV